MTTIDLKVNAIYWWRNNNDWFKAVGGVVLCIVLLPLLVVVAIWAFFVDEDEEADREWCEEHGYEYPEGLTWRAHKQVKDLKKEFNSKKRENDKKRIREELLRNRLKN